MAQGPILLFDKSTIQTLTIDESVLLDNFYMSNITPVFFAECLADLERNMGRMKGTPESLVGALASRTPDSQACGNVFHERILEGELMGKFDLKRVKYRPIKGGGQPVQTGDSKGVFFHPTEDEEAVQRWSKREFLDLERQTAKQWRRMIERIDLKSLSANMLQNIGPWRKPKDLKDAKFIADTIIDHFDQEWLLRFGLQSLGMSDATEWVVARWVNERRKPLRTWLPYFIHILSINMFFALVLPTELLSKVKASHRIDLAYLYYLPFCTVFSSRDKFHIQVAPLFMDPFQTFVSGDELQSDLQRLHDRYQSLPLEELETGLINFAPHPPDDTSFLTTRLWDKYLPTWRVPHPPMPDLPDGFLEAINQVVEPRRNATPQQAHNEHEGEPDFMTISKMVSPKKGSYLRFSREMIHQIYEDSKEKSR